MSVPWEAPPDRVSHRTVHRALLASLFLAPLLLLLAVDPAASQRLPEASPESVGMSSERLHHLSRTLQAYVDEGRLPGVSVLVLRDGRVIYEEAYGERDLAAGDPMRTDDLFRIASQTKAIVSTGVMILHEEGRLLISDPLSRYLPAFADVTVAEPTEGGGYRLVEARRPITIRHLLSHTSGIGYGALGGTRPGAELWDDAGISGWYFGHMEEPIRATVDRMAELPLYAHPGEAWIYGYNTDILGALIEEVSGRPLDEFLRNRIFEPLGMEDTHFYLPRDETDRLATVYSLRPGGRLTRAPDGPGMATQGQYVEGPRTSLSGGAGLVSTTRDYARFLQMHLNGGELGGTRVLSPKTVQLMTDDHAEGRYGRPGFGFGLGFSVRTDLGGAGTHGSIGEFGWGGAYHSTYWVDPVEDLVVVYLTQVIPASGLDDHRKLRSLVYAAILESNADLVHGLP